ncbi:MAG: hypothetical protein ACI8Q1_001480 [Parvicella sp.]|jgi:hypothetical protein
MCSLFILWDVSVAKLCLIILAVFFLSFYSVAQTQSIQFQTSFQNENQIKLDDTLVLGDSLIVISKFKYYVGFESNNRIKYTLIDFGSIMKTSLIIDSQMTNQSFYIGVDSTTNVSGALAGDLDPTKGMYWAWQSGYINFKMEGTYIYKTETTEFNYHLGGYLTPYSNAQKVELSLGNDKAKQVINLDLYPFFSQANISQSVMRPCAESVQLMQIISNSFSLVD